MSELEQVEKFISGILPETATRALWSKSSPEWSTSKWSGMKCVEIDAEPFTWDGAEYGVYAGEIPGHIDPRYHVGGADSF